MAGNIQEIFNARNHFVINRIALKSEHQHAICWLMWQLFWQKSRSAGRYFWCWKTKKYCDKGNETWNKLDDMIEHVFMNMLDVFFISWTFTLMAFRLVLNGSWSSKIRLSCLGSQDTRASDVSCVSVKGRELPGRRGVTDEIRCFKHASRVAKVI